MWAQNFAATLLLSSTLPSLSCLLLALWKAEKEGLGPLHPQLLVWSALTQQWPCCIGGALAAAGKLLNSSDA